MNTYNFNNAKFQYLISNKRDERFLNFKELSNELILNYSKDTTVLSIKDKNKEITIIGFCIDAYAELERYSIAKYLCDSIDDIESLIKLVGRLAGKYIIVFQDGKDIYIIGDASASLPVYYYFNNNQKISFSSSEYIISSFLDLNKSEKAIFIENMAAPGIGLPNNLSRYVNLFFLLPNFYLDVSKQKHQRYFTCYDPKKAENFSTILNQSMFLINNIVREYSKYYDLICPLTSGWDSRVILSFLIKNNTTECYTFNHEHFGKKSAETNIPRKICSDLNVKYSSLLVKDIPFKIKKNIKATLGSDNIEKRASLAYTIREEFGDKAIIEGSIVGHIGKSGMFGAVPDWLASDSYFITKTHSYSKESEEETVKYLGELKKLVNKRKLFDLFALEIRCGRWGNQSSELYSLLGVNMLNIFNNSELIFLWTEIARKERNKNKLHISFIKLNKLALLDYPFNSDDNLVFLKKNKYGFYLASFIKHYYNKRKLNI